MTEPVTVKALADAMDTSSKIAQTPGLMTIADRMFGFKLSEWKAQGDIFRAQKQAEYEEAQEKGLGMQYVTAFREQTNVLNIFSKASHYVKEGFERNVELDEDVFWNLIDHAKTISQEDIQNLVAQIIAGEYNDPGAYTMHTLQVLKSIGANELKKLELVGSLIINDLMIPGNLFQTPADIADFIKNIGLSFSDLQNLQTLGLVHTNTATREVPNPEKKAVSVTYFDKLLIYKQDTEEELVVKMPGFYRLTTVGQQIMDHLEPSFNQFYMDWLKNNYKIRKYSFDHIE